MPNEQQEYGPLGMERTLKHHGRALEESDWRRRKENTAGEEQRVRRPRGRNSHGVSWGPRAATVVTALAQSLLSTSYFLREEFVFAHGWR